MLAHGGASSHHRSAARRCGIRTAEQSGLHRPAPERLHYRAGRGREPDPDDRGNVARAVISEVLPTFRRHIAEPAHQPPASRALSRPRGARRSGQLTTATGSSPLRSPRYGSQEEEHKPFKEALQNAPSRTRWLVLYLQSSLSINWYRRT